MPYFWWSCCRLCLSYAEFARVMELGGKYSGLEHKFGIGFYRQYHVLGRHVC